MSPTVEPTPSPSEQIAQLLTEARGFFAQRNLRKTIDALHRAQQMATQNNLHSEASQFRRALSILSNGGRPKLLGTKGLRKSSDQ